MIFIEHTAVNPGRFPHVHFEVFPSLFDTTSGRSASKTSQFAFPEATAAEIYATAGYEESVAHLAGTSLDEDGVFRDGYAYQLTTMSGSVAAGYIAELEIGLPG